MGKLVLSLLRSYQFLSPLVVCLFRCHFTALWPCGQWGRLAPWVMETAPARLLAACPHHVLMSPSCPWGLSGWDTQCRQARPHRFWGDTGSPVMLLDHLSVVKANLTAALSSKMKASSPVCKYCFLNDWITVWRALKSPFSNAFSAVWLLNMYPIGSLHVDALTALDLYMMHANILPVWSNGSCVTGLLIWSLKLCSCQQERSIPSLPLQRGNQFSNSLHF